MDEYLNRYPNERIINEAEWKKKHKIVQLIYVMQAIQVDVLHSTFGAIYFWKVSYDKRIHHRHIYFKS